MSFKSKRLTLAIAMLLVFATSQVHVVVSFAQPGAVAPGESGAMLPQQPTGVLTTLANKEITVNGTNSISGATIVSGASIETPAGVSAMITLGSRGSLEVEPNTKLTVEFDQSSVKVVLTEGCGSLLSKKGATGEIRTPNGSAQKTDPAHDGELEICPRRHTTAVGAAEASGLLSLGAAAAVAIIVRGVTTFAVPVTPRGILY